jgi:hypothetical protein
MSGMTELFLHNQRVESIFNLLGEKENDITFSIGWALSRSPVLLERFVQKSLNVRTPVDTSEVVVALQEYEKDAGITDVEIRSPAFHLIVEAKRGWELPSQSQLGKYLPRLKNAKSKQPVIVTMSECSDMYAKHNLISQFRGVPVRHIGWREISAITNFKNGNHSEKRLMEELRIYIASFINMQKQESNLVYVVSLSSDEWVPGLTYVEVVDGRQRYFHPYGSGGWPIEPPNYIAFRHNGMLQSIHHIEKADVIDNFHPYFKEAPNASGEKYFLYELGPAIRPTKVVRTGKIYRNGRVRAMLDLLLTSDTISEARDKTDKRKGVA